MTDQRNIDVVLKLCIADHREAAARDMRERAAKHLEERAETLMAAFDKSHAANVRAESYRIAAGLIRALPIEGSEDSQ